jgi:hypothetical protein
MLAASSSRFHPTGHVFTWFAWAPPGAHAPFRAGRSLSSPTRWAPLTGTTPFLRLRPLRSLPPRASPYSRPPVARRPRAVALLGFRPSRALSRPEPRALMSRRTIPFVAELAPASSRGATSRRQVKSLRPRGRVDLVGVSIRGATAHRPVPPLGDNPASLDLGHPAV